MGFDPNPLCCLHNGISSLTMQHSTSVAIWTGIIKELNPQAIFQHCHIGVYRLDICSMTCKVNGFPWEHKKMYNTLESLVNKIWKKKSLRTRNHISTEWKHIQGIWMPNGHCTSSKGVQVEIQLKEERWRNDFQSSCFKWWKLYSPAVFSSKIFQVCALFLRQPTSMWYYNGYRWLTCWLCHKPKHARWEVNTSTISLLS
jgi:hypothetical protein